MKTARKPELKRESYRQTGREPATIPADRVATHIIETLDHLSLLARDTGHADMAAVLKYAFDQCLLGHVNAKAEQLSARIGAGRES